MTSHSFHRSTAEVRAAFIGFLEDGESRPILDTAALGPFYRLSCWGIGGSSHSDCLTYCSQSGLSYCASQQPDTATRATCVSSSLFLLFVPGRFGDQARSSILARNRWSHTLSGPATAGCLVEFSGTHSCCPRGIACPEDYAMRHNSCSVSSRVAAPRRRARVRAATVHLLKQRRSGHPAESAVKSQSRRAREMKRSPYVLHRLPSSGLR
jgi:hypothetical protein